MNTKIRFGVIVLALVVPSFVRATEPPQPNVLFLIADDLANTLGCYGHSDAKTPHIDALAKRSLIFERAYCQFPHCNPSRASMLTGLRPQTTRVTNNADDLFQNLPNVVTLPRFFRENGYVTARCGKLFHLGVPKAAQNKDDPRAWDYGLPFRDEAPYPPDRASAVKVEIAKGQGIPWYESTGKDDELIDGMYAKAAIDWLQRWDKKKPFFLAVGFHRPHVPWVAPAVYFDRYPFDDIRLPNEPVGHEKDIPEPARNGAVPLYHLTATPEQRRAAIRGYLASVSYMDAQTGRVLDALKRLGLAENTIVVFTSDHGFHLGEHQLWHKRSLFEPSARVPLLIHVPAAKGNGQRCHGLVELLDLYPTLCELTGLPVPQSVQGTSLKPLIDDPSRSVKTAAFTEARRGPKAEFWGRSVRTARWRYTEWDNGRNGVELYDHQTDPGEFHNLAKDAAHAETRAKLRKLLTP